MPSTKAKNALVALLDRLEPHYGPLVLTDDPVEAGLMTLLAEHAPRLAHEQTRDRLRLAFVDWNEMRVADRWDVVSAIGGSGNGAARVFARHALRFLRSLHGVLNRCKFDRALADPEGDVPALVGKMRGAPAATRTVMLAVLADPEWHPCKEMSKLAQKHRMIPKTTSLAKASKSFEALGIEHERLRAHYLLTRYAARGKDETDPLANGGRKPAAKAAAKKPAAAKTKTAAPSKPAAQPAVKKAAVKKTAKPVAKKPPVKKATKPVAKKTTKPVAKKPAAKKTTRRKR